MKNTQPRSLFRPPLTAHSLIMGALVLLCIGPATAVAEQAAFTWDVDSPDLEWAPCPEFMPEGCQLAVLQGNAAEPNADIFFRLPGNSKAPHHWHTSAERMVLVTGKMEVDYDGQAPVILNPGTYAYGPPELPHTATCLSDEPCTLFIAFEEPVDAHASHEH